MDEAYIQYADAPDFPDCLELRGLRERLIVLRTFSKIYGLASLRVGYAVGPPDLIDYVNRVRAPFNVGSVGQAAAIAALDDHEHVEKSRAMNLEQRALVAEELSRLDVRVVPSQANFVWVDVRRPGREVYQRLLEKGVIVRPVGGPTHLRVTIGTPRENERMLAAFREVLS